MNKLHFVVYILVALVLCVFLFVFILYRYALPRFEGSLMELEYQKLDFMVKSFDIKAGEAEYTASAYLIDEIVRRIMLEDSQQTSFERIKAIQEIESRLEVSVISTTGIEAIYLCRYPDAYFISYPSIGYHTRVIRRHKMELLRSFDIGQGWISDSENTLYYYVTYPYNEKHGKNVEYASVIEMQKSYINDLLGSAINSEYSGVIMVLPGLSSYIQKGLSPEGLAEEILFNSNVVGNSGEKQIYFDSKSYLVLSHYSNTYDISFITYYDKTLLTYPVRIITFIAMAFIAVIIIMAVILQFLFHRNIVKQIYLLVANFQRVEKGDFSAKIETDPKNEFKYLFDQFNEMTAGLKKLIESLDIELKQRFIAENKHIQAQISPHFLYNSLFYIISVADKPEAVTKMASHLAEYYQYKTRTKERVLLSDEIRFAENYLTIISLRKNISFEIDTSNTLNHVTILPLLIQPLIENAVVYGIEEKEGSNRIVLAVTDDETGFSVKISDDGPGMTEYEIKLLYQRLSNNTLCDSVGLFNVNKRLVTYYGKSAELKFGRDEVLGGFKVSFYVPFDK